MQRDLKGDKGRRGHEDHEDRNRRVNFPIGRAIGIGVIGIAAMVGLMLWFAITLSDPTVPELREMELLNRWVILVSDYRPPVAVLVTAVVAACVFVVVAVSVEQIVSKRYRVSTDAEERVKLFVCGA